MTPAIKSEDSDFLKKYNALTPDSKMLVESMVDKMLLAQQMAEPMQKATTAKLKPESEIIEAEPEVVEASKYEPYRVNENGIIEFRVKGDDTSA
jgi:hypothetical protein